LALARTFLGASNFVFSPMLNPAEIKIYHKHLPKDDFPRVGVCFSDRELKEGQAIDTLIIHSCYVSPSIIAPLDPTLVTDLTEARARELAQRWVAERAELQALTDPAQIAVKRDRIAALEYAAMHTLIATRHGKAALTQFDPTAICEVFEFYGFTAHYLIDRRGTVHELVPPDLRAFHSGKSKMPRTEDGREGVSQFSIGIELIADHNSGYTEPQLSALIALTRSLIQSYPLINFYGHSDIAPERKTDPWGFDWQSFLSAINFDPQRQFSASNTPSRCV